MNTVRVICAVVLIHLCAVMAFGQIGKNVPVPAGSDADKQLKAINAANDPAEKLKLIDAFAQAHADGDFAILADEQYVNYYLNAKQYDKAFEYGDKLFALDPDNYQNALNMVRAANEKGDNAKAVQYAEKAGMIVQKYKAAPAPSGTTDDAWSAQKKQTLAGLQEDQDYVEKSYVSAAYRETDPAQKAAALSKFAKIFPDSGNAGQAGMMAAFAYQQAQKRPEMQAAASAALAKDPNNIAMLILLADDYAENNEQLDKATEYAKKAAGLCDTAKKPDGVSDADWQSQITLQKGLALSALGEVNLQKKQNAQAADSLKQAAPLLKSNAVSYARNQYRLGFAYINLKNSAGARQAFTDAASVDSPYKGPAQEKLKGLGPGKPAARKAAS
jgi:tetratricopeptide (TPR) repeat protein